MNLEQYYDALYEQSVNSDKYCDYCDCSSANCECHKHDDYDRRKDAENE